MTDEPTTEPTTLTVTEALARLSFELGPIAKADRMTGAAGNYSYRGIDALLRKLSPLMAAHGVTFVPNVVERIVEPITVGRDGKQWRLVTLLVRYTVTGPGGDSIEVTTCGEGSDAGDKAANKAMTSAYKQALVQCLAIADGHDDPDDFASEPAEPARRAPSPARERSNGSSHATRVTAAGDRSDEETAIRAVLRDLDDDAAAALRAAFGERFGSGLVGLDVERHAEALAWVKDWTFTDAPTDDPAPAGS